MPQLQPLPATAGDAKGLHGLLDGNHNRGNRHYHPVYHDVFVPIEIDRALPRKSGETHRSIAHVFGHNTIDEDLRHNGRFDKHNSHDFAPSEPARQAALREVKHGSMVSSRYRCQPIHYVIGDAFRAVNTSATCAIFTQISRKKFPSHSLPSSSQAPNSPRLFPLPVSGTPSQTGAQ